MAWRVNVLTLFPEMFPGPLGMSLAGKALNDGLWRLETLDIRSVASDKHRSVDDTPYGGGAGMVLRPDVVDAAINCSVARFGEVARKVFLSPRGKRLDQAMASKFVADGSVMLVCGRYEGLDQRVIDAQRLEEVSLGDFVLSGGEVAAMALIDACVRLLPGVMGNAATVDEESFSAGLLEYPQYTRPPEWNGRDVPEVLISGNHEKIKAWRQAEAEKITRSQRPDLWEIYQCTRTRT
ncbi:MAG: tRNA (guanosine(37)-N1)-methyltransferase TrmD [Alphaproteobacteria bacterium]|nr:tRNA (guanosine(37)-N1)-methyltransferase TrmD [Alphaproteobacteria bacterium]